MGEVINLPRRTEPVASLPGEPPRWVATVIYRSAAGPKMVVHEIEEIEDLQELIEQGPNFYCIMHISLNINEKRRQGHRPTIEEAQEL